MDALGLIFSNIHNKEIFEVTISRTIASAPIGGRYRLIDFALSSMVNAGVTSVGVITKNNYQSLMDHVGSGKEWDLDRKRGGLCILPPNSTSFMDQNYSTRLEAVRRNRSFIAHSQAKYVILTDCYQVWNIDYRDVLEKHIASGADLTCVYRKSQKGEEYFLPTTAFTLDSDGRVVKMDLINKKNQEFNESVDTWVIKRELLLSLIDESFQTNYTSFNRDIISRNLNNLKVYGYEFKGYFGNIFNLQTYLKVNMDLLDKDVRDELFNQDNHAIYTKVRDSAPTLYKDGCVVENSLIADGCVIEGEVRNSIIFRGAQIKKGCKVCNSVLMQDTSIGENINIDYVITDKNAQIVSKKEMIGDIDHPIYIKKNGVI